MNGEGSTPKSKQVTVRSLPDSCLNIEMNASAVLVHGAFTSPKSQLVLASNETPVNLLIGCTQVKAAVPRSGCLLGQSVL